MTTFVNTVYRHTFISLTEYNELSTFEPRDVPKEISYQIILVFISRVQKYLYQMHLVQHVAPFPFLNQHININCYLCTLILERSDKNEIKRVTKKKRLESFSTVLSSYRSQYCVQQCITTL
jgi:hypothetical protein